MIKSAADLMQALVEKEKVAIAAVPDLNHMPMLGAMYEGLAKNLVKTAIFEGLAIRVVDGKVRFEDGKLSGQIDVMVVEGEGDKLPHSESWIYDCKNVIAIIEVKKTLYGVDLADAFIHLREVCEPKFIFDKRHSKLIKDAWKSIMGCPFPNDYDAENLPEPDKLIRASLLLDAHRPMRVILGYGGFQTEGTLRSGLIKFVTETLPLGEKQEKPVAGFGVTSFPELIICGSSCIVKLNGMPMAAPRSADGFWPVLASHSGNPFRTLLELLWTRLAYRHKITAAIFGEDLEVETLNELADARWSEVGKGWEFRITKVSAAGLAASPQFTEWKPPFLSKAEFVVVNLLCHGQSQRIDNDKLHAFLKDEGTTIGGLIGGLAEKGLIYIENSELHLLTDQCLCAVIPTEGGAEYVAGENKTGRLARWVARNTERVRRARDVSAG